MSRWKCMVPFGSPVVPEVKAIRQTSSLAVSQAAKRLVAWLRHQRFERVGRARCPNRRRAQSGRQRARLLHLFGEACVAQRQRDLRLVERIGDLLGAQQRHGRDHDAAGLDDGELGRDHHRVVRTAQQHAIAGHEAEIAREHVGDAVHPLRELRVGQRSPPARSGTAGRRARPRPSGRATRPRN